jgi:type I restriction enzyme R subunit
LQHQFTTDLQLESANTPMQGLTPGGNAKVVDEELEWLTRIIKVLNDTFGIEVTEDDKVEIAKMKDNVYTNEELMSYFNTRNSKENIKDKFSDTIDNELLNFINNKLELYNKLSEDKVNNLFKTMWFNEIYDQRVRGIL